MTANYVLKSNPRTASTRSVACLQLFRHLSRKNALRRKGEDFSIIFDEIEPA